MLLSWVSWHALLSALTTPSPVGPIARLRHVLKSYYGIQYILLCYTVIDYDIPESGTRTPANIEASIEPQFSEGTDPYVPLLFLDIL